MNRPTGITVAAVSVLLLAAATTGTHAQHLGPPATSDQVGDAACRDINNARSQPDLRKVAEANENKSNRAVAEANQKVASAEQKEREAGAALHAAAKAAVDEKVRLSNVETSTATAAGYDNARKAAKAKLDAIDNLKTNHALAEQAVADQKTYRMTGPNAQRDLQELEDKAKALKTQLDNTNRQAAQEEFDEADNNYKRTPTGDVETMRRQIVSLNQKEASAAAAHQAEKQKLTAAQRELSTVQARQTEVARCVAVRTAQLDPILGPELKSLDDLLARIEARLGQFGTRAPQLAADCTPMLAEIEALQREAAALARDAAALAAKAATPQAQPLADYQQRASRANLAEIDARRAAAAITNAKAHAVKAAQDACIGSDWIVKHLADPAAPGRLTNVKRSQTEAEQDVAQTAAALDRIRAANAAVVAAGSLQTPLTQELSLLKTRAGNLKRRRDAAAEKATDFSDFNWSLWAAVTRLASLNERAIAASQNSSPSVYRLRATRIAVLLNRGQKIDRTCVSRISPAFVAMDSSRHDADAKIIGAAQAIGNTGVLAEPRNIGPEIERIFNAARTEAEAVAAEATKAVRCWQTAQNALANPPVCKGTPPAGAALKPDRPGGLTCKYQCGSSAIEFTVYDGTTTCVPKIEDYALVSSSRSGGTPSAGKLIQSGPTVVKTGTKNVSGAAENTTEYTSTTARATSVDGTAYRRDIQWTFTAPPVSFSPGEEIRIDVSGKVNTTNNGVAVKLPAAPSGGVRVRGLETVKAELAWANTGEGKPSTFVFRVPPNATGATIEFGADWDIGVFAHYYYGDHKKP